jgi:hypothetical protein
MPYPTQDFNHVNEGLALLTGQFSSDLLTPNVRNLVRTLMRRTQSIENTLWDVIDSQLLALQPTGQALNQLGDLVGEPRGAFNDVQYRLFITVIIAARKSGARTEDLLTVLALALGTAAFDWDEFYPGRASALAPSVATDLYAQPLAQALHIARPPGVYTILSYWDVTYPLPVWELSDSVSGTGGVGLGDSVSGTGFCDVMSSIRF